MLIFDENPNVTKWASEELAIPYMSPVDRKKHKYYPDFIVEMKNKEGVVETLMIEVKPKKQTEPPKKPKRQTKRFLNEAKTYLTNQAKWDAANAFCERKGWRFKILTEKEIFWQIMNSTILSESFKVLKVDYQRDRPMILMTQLSV